MVKVKYNSRNVDRSGGGNISPPQPGTYKMLVKEVKFEEDNGSHADRLVFITQMQVDDAKGNGKNYRFWDYVNLDVDWKVDQWLQASGVDTESKPEGEIDTRKFKNLTVLGRVKEDHWKGEYRPKLAGVFEWTEDEEDEFDEDLDDLEEAVEAEEEEYDEEEDEEEYDEEEEEDEDEDEDWEDEEEEEEPEPEPKPRPRKKAAAKKAAAPRKKAAAKASDDEYDDLETPALKKECKSRGLAVSGSRSALLARLRLNDADPFADDE